jgi:hypothetical protein
MDNIKKLRRIGILGDVRQRLGAIDEKDDTLDDEINGLDNSKLIELHCGWKLGDGSWWTDFKQMFDTLEEIDKRQEAQ